MMVKKLRRKFVLTAMISLLLILIGIIGVINIVNFTQVQAGADDTLNILAENDGMFPDMRDRLKKPVDESELVEGESAPFENVAPQDFSRSIFDKNLFYNRTIELPFQSRYFWVKISEIGKVEVVDTGHIAAITSTDAGNYAKSLFFNSRNKTRGYIDNHYRYLISQNDDGSYLMIFFDCSDGFYSATRLLLMTLLIGFVALIAMFILVYLFSGKAVQPVVESLEKQKRFITDAGHELKTPLAVISANMDVIELEAGASEWTKSTKNQIKRMNELVKNLLALSRMEEENIHLVFSDIDISKIVNESTAYFNAVSDFKNIRYTTNIEDDVHINGDKNAFNQLCTLLIDNAMKYTHDGGDVSVTLSSDRKSRNAILEVVNSCEKMPEGNLDRLFDRFYREDNSRSRETGGYGIGLSVARAIATSHGGTIEAKADGENRIKFVVRVPIMKIKTSDNNA
ncbi:sensor histidine kinase [Butyrivibrio sp. WCE2006]|uniref:sensor histidine kinase n=1 Tax=Butyrivibrio sp. WCE2006 TaxID=1410611 RepID=UPI0009DEB66E|nr:HAMP domain-containing sensor histidine kinase [Butyrivibrio sp. WCE2006]